jgi:hypothetical protein
MHGGFLESMSGMANRDLLHDENKSCIEISMLLVNYASFPNMLSCYANNYNNFVAASLLHQGPTCYNPASSLALSTSDRHAKAMSCPFQAAHSTPTY